LSLSGGANGKKDRKIAKKRPKNSIFKPLSTIFVPCVKIQGGTAPLPPAADAHAINRKSINCLLDTGASEIFMSETVAREFHPQGKPSKVSLASDNSTAQVLEKV